VWTSHYVKHRCFGDEHNGLPLRITILHAKPGPWILVAHRTPQATHDDDKQSPVVIAALRLEARRLGIPVNSVVPIRGLSSPFCVSPLHGFS